MYDHQLKTAPKGFPKDHEYIDLLKYKSYVFSNKLDNSDLSADGFIEHAVKAFKQLYKVNAFLGKAVETKI